MRRATPHDGAVGGFTLVEVVISLTILSLVVLVLYMSFSTATDTWRRQAERTDQSLRREALRRLVSDDFADLRPFTLNWEAGQEFFFVGGPGAVFYVTGNGLGSTRRDGRLLFFTLLFASREEDGTLALRVHKRPVPARGLVEALHDYSLASSLQREGYTPPGDILEDSALVLGGLSDVLLSYAPAAARREEGADTRIEAVPAGEPAPLAATDWVRTLPGEIQVEYRMQGVEAFERLRARTPRSQK